MPKTIKIAIAASSLIFPMLAGFQPASAAASAPTTVTTKISNTTPVQTYTDGAHAAVSTDDSTGKSLAIWLEPHATVANEGYVVGQILNETGLPTGSQFIINTTFSAPATNGYVPLTVSTGPDGEWIVIWNDSGTRAVYGQIVEADGTLKGSNFQVSAGSTYGSIWGHQAVAWSPDSNRYFVTWRSVLGGSTPFPNATGTKLVGRFLDSTGAGIGGDFIVTSEPEVSPVGVEMAYGKNLWIVVYSTLICVPGGCTYENRLQKVSTAGPQGVSVNASTSASFGLGSTISYNSISEKFLLGFYDNTNRVSAVRFLDSAAIPEGSNISVANSARGRIRIESIASEGFMLYWHDLTRREIRGQIISNTGTLDSVVSLTSNTDAMWSDLNARLFRPSADYSSTTGNAIVLFTANPAVPNETNIYSTYWSIAAASASTNQQALPPAPSMSVSGILVSENKVVISGSLFEKIKSATINGQSVQILSLTGEAIELALPALAPGSYEITLVATDAKLTWQDGLVIKPQPAKGMAVPVNQSIAPFAPNSASLTDSQKAKIRSLVQGATSVVCVGSASTKRITRADKVIAERRARAACNYVASLDSSIVTRISVAKRMTAEASSRRVTLQITR